ncbi:MAG: DUF58 domain-containing protein [Ardenticatenaceae bacterium]
MRHILPILLLLFVIAAWLRVDFYLNILYLLFGVYFFSRFWTRRTLERLKIERHFVARAFLGDDVTVELVVQNQDWLPVPWLEINESLPVELSTPPFFHKVISLQTHETRRLRYTLRCRRRGYYPIGGMSVDTGDLLGMVANRVMQFEPSYLTVYPKVLPLHKLGLPTRSPFVVLSARSPLFEDPTRVRGVREYQRGDSPRRIHWSASASRGRLLVKQYQPAIAREMLICLNLNEEDYQHSKRFTATELAIVVAASIANHIIMQEKLPVGLATQAIDPMVEQSRHILLPPRRERTHLMHLLEVLARVQVTNDAPFAERVRRESVNLSWGSTLTVITGTASQPLIETLLYLRQAGLAVALLLIQPAALSPDIQTRSQHLRLPIYRIWDEQIEL